MPIVSSHVKKYKIPLTKIIINLSKGYLLINVKTTTLCMFSVTSMKIFVVTLWSFKNGIISGNISCLEKRGKMANSQYCLTLQVTEYMQSNQYLHSVHVALDDDNCNIPELPLASLGHSFEIVT